MAVDVMSGMTAVATMVSGMRTKSTVSASTSGQMVVNTMDNGVIIICTAVVSTHGKTEENMKEST